VMLLIVVEVAGTVCDADTYLDDNAETKIKQTLITRT